MVHIDRLEFWARLLAIPDSLRWFNLAPKPPSPDDVPTLSTRATAGSGTRLSGVETLPLAGPAVARPLAALGMAGYESDVQTDEMLRRTLLQALTAYGVGSRSAPATSRDAAEARHAPVDALISEWHQACEEYGFEYHTRPRRELALDLLGDLLDVRELLATTSRDAQMRSVAGVVARLAGLAALACTDLGYRREVKHMWRLARRTADLARDPHALQWVCGHEATSGIYYGRPLPVVMAIADQGLAVGDKPTAGRAELLGARAQALAIAGEHHEAARVLGTLRETFDGLPDRVTRSTQSIMEWPEQRLRHAESFVYSTAGALTLATRAQDRARELYAPSRPISRAQIEFHHAECLVRSGHVSEGVAHARETLATANQPWRNRYVLAVAEEVANAVPESHRTQPSFVGLRRDLADALTPFTGRTSS